jgi:hypothetical protein
MVYDALRCERLLIGYLARIERVWCGAGAANLAMNGWMQREG